MRPLDVSGVQDGQIDRELSNTLTYTELRLLTIVSKVHTHKRHLRRWYVASSVLTILVSIHNKH